MVKDRLVAVLLALAASAPLAAAQAPARRVPAPASLSAASSEPLRAPSVADRLLGIAHGIEQAEPLTPARADQAIILARAAKRLGAQSDSVERLLLALATRHAVSDHARQVMVWLEDYVGESADRVIVGQAIRYLLDRRDSPDERQVLLERLVERIGNRNPAVDSDLATRLGLLMLEENDQEAGRFYLVQAYANNKYNRLAFATLAELAPDEIGPSIYLEHLRLIVREDPLDLNAALNFAQYAERLQLYDVASHSYRYCAELFRYLYPTEPLPPHVYLPWAISSYNTQRQQFICLQIAENVRKGGRFDILLEAIAGRAAAQTGNPAEARRIFRQAERRATRLLQAGGPGQEGGQSVRPINAKQLAWFHCFADPNVSQALDWAHKAFATEPNSPSAAALLAYALTLTDQVDYTMVKPLLASFENNQIADLVQAKIYLAEGRRGEALESLTLAVTKDPGSLAAEQAKRMLREHGSQYAPPVDPDTLITFLKENLAQAVVPKFAPPEERIDVQFNVRGDEFSYGTDIEGTVALLNRASEPLVLTDRSLFRGHIRVDARVAAVYREDGGSGETATETMPFKRVLLREIPRVVSRTIRTQMTVAPDRSLVTSVDLSAGQVGRTLARYPQASLEIEFTLYLDPEVANDGSVANRLAGLAPVTVTVRRPGVELTGSYVRNRFNSMYDGQPGQRVRTARLFVGLLKERQTMAERGTLYPYRYRDWLGELLRSALVSDAGLLLGERPESWVVTTHTMVEMLSLSMDQELAGAVSKNLDHPQWPVRLIAVYLLANAFEDAFGSALDWVAEYDANDLVRQMAVALRADAVRSGRPTAAALLSSPLP
jgi:tetratricopeptide (TPR) repeat protein